MKTYVLYHANCNDGFGAAWAVWLLMGELATYLPVKYGEAMPAMEDGSEVLIVDFSYPRAELEALRARMNRVTVIDHHATAKQDLQGLDYAHFDMSKSGAVLTWEHVFPGKPVPRLLLYIQDRDLWQWQLPESREVSAALSLYPQDFHVWADLAQQIDHLREQGRIARKVVDQQAKRSATHAKLRDVGGHVVPVLNCSCFQSETAHEMLELNPDAPFVALFTESGDGTMRRWSLRSRKDFDCSVIAKQFSGGGHPQACGFEQRIEPQRRRGTEKQLQLALVRVAALLESLNTAALAKDGHEPIVKTIAKARALLDQALPKEGVPA